MKIPNYLSLAMVPNSLNKPSSWWLVSSFASKENLSNPRPYLEVYTKPAPDPPIANAGDDQIADANETVTLDGSASYDNDGDITTYTWTRLPDNVVLHSGSEPIYDTKALGRVEEVIELTVTDNDGASGLDTMSILNRKVEDTGLQDLVDKIASFPPIKKWLERQ